MDERKSRYLYAFNELASLLKYNELIEDYCRDVKDCEKTLDLIKCVTDRMTNLIKLMEMT